MKTKKKPLHDILCGILGSSNCYFSPPSNIKMRYPCIRYEISGLPSNMADNIRYKTEPRYTIIIIDENPDSKIVEKILELPYCSFDRFYVVEGLNHFVFSLYYKGPRFEEVENEPDDKGGNEDG